MNINKIKRYEFCSTCRDEVEVEIKDVKKTKIIKGVEIKYDYKEVYCKDCGTELIVNEIRDENLIKMNEAYRK